MSERVRRAGGTLNEYNTANSPEQADTLALWSDWLAVGDDMRSAIRAFEAEHADEIAGLGKLPANPASTTRVPAPPTVPLYSGPIPSPGTLAQYEKAVPGAADRILTMAEREHANQRRIEMATVSNDERRGMVWLGLWLAVALGALAVAGAFAALGYPAFGLATAMLATASFSGMLVYGTNLRSKDRAVLLEETLGPTTDALKRRPKTP